MMSWLDLKESDAIPLWLCVHQAGRIKALLIEAGAEDVDFTTSDRDELEARVSYKETKPTLRADKPETLRHIPKMFNKWRAQRG